MKKHINPLVLDSYDIDRILEFQRQYGSYLSKEVAAIETPLDIQQYKSQYPGESEENVLHMVQHHCAKDVIQAVHDIVKDPSLYAYELARRIGLEYGKIDDTMRKNPEEMLKLVAYRSDAILLVDKSIFDKDFLEKAIQYNPRVYKFLPIELQRSQAVIDIYRDTLYKTGAKSHPVFFEIQEEIAMNLASVYGKDKMQRMEWEESETRLSYKQDLELLTPQQETDRYSVPISLRLPIMPAYIDDKLFSVPGYEQMFTHTLLNLRDLRIECDTTPIARNTDELNTPTNAKLSDVPATIQYLAMCRNARPELSTQFKAVEVKAYQEHKSQIKQQAHNVRTKTFLAEFCLAHGLPAEPEWLREFNQLERRVNPLHIAGLKHLQHDIDDVHGNRYYTLTCMQSVFCAMRDCSPTLVQELLNTEDFWTDIGRYYAELEKELQDPTISRADREHAQKDIDSIKVYMEGESPLLKQIAPYIEIGRQGLTQEHTGPVIGE